MLPMDQGTKGAQKRKVWEYQLVRAPLWDVPIRTKAAPRCGGVAGLAQHPNIFETWNRVVPVSVAKRSWL